MAGRRNVSAGKSWRLMLNANLPSASLSPHSRNGADPPSGKQSHIFAPFTGNPSRSTTRPPYANVSGMPGAGMRTIGSFAGAAFPAISFLAGISFDGGSGFGSPETPSATPTANTDAARQAAPADNREPIPTDRASADTATEGR